MKSTRLGEGRQWTKTNDDYHSPIGDEVGPNQLVLLEEHVFRDGSIEATVSPRKIQDGCAKKHPECGLIGRYRGPDSYIFAGLGGHGHAYSISKWTSGGFIELAREGSADDIGGWNERRLRLEFEGANVRLLLCNGDEREILSTKTDAFAAGRCGLRVDWTEAHFDRVRASSTDRACLVIAPIGAAGSGSRVRSDYVLDHIIRPALAECGYKAERADDIAGPGMINEEIITRLLNDPLVIADLTSHNPNVFYELAIRHATHRPFVQIIERGASVPFDVKDMRTLEVDLGMDKNIEEAKDQLQKYVSAIEQGDQKRVHTPIPWTLRP